MKVVLLYIPGVNDPNWHRHNSKFALQYCQHPLLSRESTLKLSFVRLIISS